LWISILALFFPRIFVASKSSTARSLLIGILNFLRSLGLIFSAVLFRYTGFKGILLFSNKEQWEALVSSDLILMKGGSYIFSYGRWKDNLFIYRMLLTPLLGVLLRKKVVFLSHSIGPINGKIERFLTKYVLGRTRAIILRENLSYEYVKHDLKLNGPLIDVLPDLAFYTESQGIKTYKIYKKQPLVGFTIRHWDFPQKKDPYSYFEKYISGITEIIDYIRKDFNAKILLIPHCMDDIVVMQQIYAKFKNPENIFIIQEDYSLVELRTLLGSLSILIGTRIHSNILAISEATPVIPVVYEVHKGYGIMQMAGIEKESIFEISNLDVATLKRRIKYLLQDTSNFHERKCLYAKVTSLREDIPKKIEGYLKGVLCNQRLEMGKND